MSEAAAIRDPVWRVRALPLVVRLLRLSWPDDEALLILGNRTAASNITLEDVRTLTDRWEAAYTYDA